jgi:hypothetical protein
LNNILLRFEQVFFLIVSISLFSFVLYTCNYGYGFLDEGFYLHWAKNPFLPKSALSLFGYVTHLIWLFSFKNLIAFRIFGVTLVFFSFAFLSGALSKQNCFEFTPRKINLQAFSNGFAGLAIYSVGSLTTPSYNHLNLIGIAVVLGTLCRLAQLSSDCVPDKENSRNLTFGVFFLHTGFLLSGLSKPTSGILLVCMYFGFAFFLSKTVNIKILKTGAVLTVFIAAAYVFFPSVAVQVKNGIKIEAILEPKHSFLAAFKHCISYFKALTHLIFDTTFYLHLPSLVAALVCLKITRLRFVSLLLVCFFFLSINYTHLFSMGLNTLNVFHNFVKPQVYLFIILCLLKMAEEISFTNSIEVKLCLKEIALGVLIAAMPLVFSFGSSNSLLEQSVQAGGFYIVANIYLSKSISNSAISRIASLTSKLIGISGVFQLVVVYGGGNPYDNKGPLLDQKSEVKIMGSKIFVAPEKALVLEKFQECFKQNDVPPNFSAVDLTGFLPGVIFFLEGNPISNPWIPTFMDSTGSATKEWLLLDKDLTRKDFMLFAGSKTGFKLESILTSVSIAPTKLKLVCKIQVPFHSFEASVYSYQVGR